MQVELLDRQRWRTRIELANALFEYLEIFHSRQRRRSSLGMRTPIELRFRSRVGLALQERGRLIAALYLGVPTVIASSIFATTFQRAAIGTVALASNLLGSVIGGLLEYTSMVVGLRALSLLAFGMYGRGSFVLESKQTPASYGGP